MSQSLEEQVARAIALEFDVDPDVFIGFHGREAWEKQWHPIARAAIAAAQFDAKEFAETAGDCADHAHYWKQRCLAAEEALALADATLRGANMNLNVVERKVKAALAQQEQLNDQQ